MVDIARRNGQIVKHDVWHTFGDVSSVNEDQPIQIQYGLSRINTSTLNCI